MAEITLTLDEIMSDWHMASTGLSGWRTEAKESYDFAAGHQWDADDLAKLGSEERPAITFDRIGTFLDAVCGMEVNNRQAIKYYPVEAGDAEVDDSMTKGVNFYEKECGAADEDSEAARDALICGIGVTETVISFDRHEDGAPDVIRRDPLDVWFDPRAARRNLSDRQFQFHGNWISKAEAEARWPEVDVFNTEALQSGSTVVPNADLTFMYKDDTSADEQNSHKDQVFILHYQCWRGMQVYRVKDPQTGSMLEIPEGPAWTAAKKFAAERQFSLIEGKNYVKGRKKVYLRAFVSGDQILEQSKLPVNQFTFNFITYKRDRNLRRWYGLVRTAKDPQRWTNKWLSQILHIVNTNAKGGAFFETGAFANARKAEEIWAQPNPLIQLNEGGLNKIRERAQAEYPNGLDRLMQFAFNSLPAVLGINLEAMGLADREQAAELERSRRQSAYTMLAPFFASVREHRRERGYLLLEIVQKLVPEGALIQIMGEGKAQFVPLIKQNKTYNVIVDQSPDSPDFKRDTWNALIQLVPPMIQAGMPVPPEIIEQSPLPPDLARQWVQYIKTQGWMPPQQKQQIEQGQQALQQLGEENKQLKDQATQKQTENALEMMDMRRKLQEADQRTQGKLQASGMEAATERMRLIVEAHQQDMDRRLELLKSAEESRNAELARHADLLSEFVKAASTHAAAVASKKNVSAKAKRGADGTWTIEG